MLTPAELQTLADLLQRIQSEQQPSGPGIQPGDVAQIRPGVSRTWETSLVLISQIDHRGRPRGPILKPHRGGCREAWYDFSPPELAIIGRAPYAGPASDIRAWSYEPPCPLCTRKPPSRALDPQPASFDQAQALNRELARALRADLAAEARLVAAATRRRPRRRA